MVILLTVTVKVNNKKEVEVPYWPGNSLFEVMQSYVEKTEGSFVVDFRGDKIGYALQAIDNHWSESIYLWSIYVDYKVVEDTGLNRIPLGAGQRVDIVLASILAPGIVIPPKKEPVSSKKAIGKVNTQVNTVTPLDVPLFEEDTLMKVLETSYRDFEQSFMLEYFGRQRGFRIRALNHILSEPGKNIWTFHVDGELCLKSVENFRPKPKQIIHYEITPLLK